MRTAPTAPLALALLVLAGSSAASDADHVLVHYDFDRETVDTGPYTLMVFEHSAGTVQLTEAYRHSGHRSVEIIDVAADGDFSELQGHFPHRTTGKVFVHFALMTAEPLERFNVALAGPAHFTVRKDGLGIWLRSDGGGLHQITDGRDDPLFTLRAFAWYEFDLVYDVDAGSYDLIVLEEGDPDPVVERTGVRNVAGASGSGLDRFSFIGDIPGVDGSNAHFFLDDLVVTADRPVPRGPFVAPGRRTLFVDMWDHYRREMYAKPGCPPVLGYEDFGLAPYDLQELAGAGVLQAAEAFIDGGEPPDVPRNLAPQVQRVLEALRTWRSGCDRDGDCDAACAAGRFERVVLPDAKLPPMCRVMALTSAGRHAEANELFLSIYPEWRDDPRFPALSATLGIARGDLAGAERELLHVPEEPAAYADPALRRLWSGEIDRGLIADLKRAHGAGWADHVEAALSAEQRFYVLLWQERHDEAALYAERMAGRFRSLDLPAGRWVERAADADFHAGRHEQALRGYRAALDQLRRPTRVLLKLSDVLFKLGDLEGERAYREKIYGTLEPRWTRRDPEPGIRPDPCFCPGDD